MYPHFYAEADEEYPKIGDAGEWIEIRSLKKLSPKYTGSFLNSMEFDRVWSGMHQIRNSQHVPWHFTPQWIPPRASKYLVEWKLPLMLQAKFLKLQARNKSSWRWIWWIHLLRHISKYCSGILLFRSWSRWPGCAKESRMLHPKLHRNWVQHHSSSISWSACSWAYIVDFYWDISESRE